jgi:hypothetical protein
LASATSGINVTTAGVLSDIDGNVVIGDVIDLGSATTGINITTAGLISDIDGNIVLGDQTDIGSATTGIRVTTAGGISDIDGDFAIGDNTTIAGTLSLTGIISDSDSNLILDDIVDIGSASTGLNITTAGVISDIDGDISLNDNTGVTGNLTVSGTTTFGGISYTWPGAQSADAVLSNNGSGTLTWTTIATNVGNFWRQAEGVLYPANSTVDFVIGATATSGAKFAVTNVNSGTPTASVSGSGNNAIFITAAGNLGTTNAQTLNLGGSSTGNVVIDSGSSSIILSDNTTLSGTLTLTGTISDSDSNLVLDDTVDIGSAATGIRVGTTGSSF